MGTSAKTADVDRADFLRDLILEALKGHHAIANSDVVIDEHGVLAVELADGGEMFVEITAA